MTRLVEYRGVRVAEGWPEQMQEAQQKTHYRIEGELVPRIRYGKERRRWGPGPRRSCHDCAVISGEFHVPSCDCEQCPRCRGQVLTCGCPYDEGERPEL